MDLCRVTDTDLESDLVPVSNEEANDKHDISSKRADRKDDDDDDAQKKSLQNLKRKTRNPT